MIAYGLLSVVDGGCWWCLLLVLDVGCSSSNRIIFNDSVTTPSTSFALRHWQGDSGRRGECSARRRQLGRMAGSQKPFVRLVASALRCKNNCIKWPRTATGLERFSSAAWERRGKRERGRERELQQPPRETVLQFCTPWLELPSFWAATGGKPVCRLLQMQLPRDGAGSPLQALAAH